MKNRSTEVDEESSRRRWEDLPADCLVTVFSKLKLEDKILNLPLVCKSWYEASLDPQCWRVLDFGENQVSLTPWSTFIARFSREFFIDDFSFSSFMKLVISRSYRSAVELAFPFLFGPSIQDIMFASAECPRLKKLVLPNIVQQDETLIRQLIGTWRNLEQLELGLKPTNLDAMLETISNNCPNLSKLKMYGWFNTASAKSIANHLPKLKSLSLSGSFLCKEQLILILENCSELESLDVSRCRGFGVDDEEILKKSMKLKQFNCRGSKLEEDYWDECPEYGDVCWAMICGDY